MLRSRIPYPVEIVLHPDWWHKKEGLCFDADFFYHPLRRVEDEARMDKILYDRWGRYGLGGEGDAVQVGAVHLAAGFMVSEMLGCPVDYAEDGPPVVRGAALDEPSVDPVAAFKSPAFKRFDSLLENLRTHHGSVKGDVNWGGVLNIAMDLRGEAILSDMYDRPEETKAFFDGIGSVLERFTGGVASATGSSSISVNRIVRHFDEPILLHSECSHTMISQSMYDEFLFGVDLAWSKTHQPFGIHYCGADPHRFATSFARLPRLDLLDLGWGGDIKVLRASLPETFFSIRLSPVAMASMSPEEVEATMRRMAAESGDPRLTGFCCVNMDSSVGDAQIEAILSTAASLREELPQD